MGPNDLLIAAQTRSLGLTLVTENEREFRRVRLGRNARCHAYSSVTFMFW